MRSAAHPLAGVVTPLEKTADSGASSHAALSGGVSRSIRLQISGSWQGQPAAGYGPLATSVSYDGGSPAARSTIPAPAARYRRLSGGSAAKRGPRRDLVEKDGVREGGLEPCYRAFGLWVRRRRLRSDLTQQALADRLRVSREWVAGVEGGFQRVMLHQVLALADLFEREGRR